jgi:hypothetical protein
VSFEAKRSFETKRTYPYQTATLTGLWTVVTVAVIIPMSVKTWFVEALSDSHPPDTAGFSPRRKRRRWSLRQN